MTKKTTLLPEYIVPMPVRGGKVVMVDTRDYIKNSWKYVEWEEDERGILHRVKNGIVSFLINELMGPGDFEQLSNDESDFRRENLVER